MVQEQQVSLLLAKQGNVELVMRPIPSPQGKQALVKVPAATISPLDWKIVDYGIFLTKFPAILGVDGAGEIKSARPDVTGFKKCDKIFFQGRYSPLDDALFQQYVLVDTEIVSKIPSNIGDDEAATIPVGSMTSVAGLFQKSGTAFPASGPTATGSSVLIRRIIRVVELTIPCRKIAAHASPFSSGSVGSHRWLTPIITTAFVQHTEYLKSLGATHVCDRNVDAKTIQAASPFPITLALDTVAASGTRLLAFDVLSTPPPAPGAYFAVVLEVDPAVKAKNVDDKVSFNQLHGDSRTFKNLAITFYRAVGKWIEDGKCVPNRVHLVKGGLAAIPEALDLSRKGLSGVKVVIRLQE